MTTEEEVARLRHVYGTYRLSPAVRARSDGTNPGNRAMVAERDAAVRELLAVHGLLPLGERTVLEIGCNTGDLLATWTRLGASPARLHGVDLLPDRIAEARRRYPALQWHVGNAEALEFPDARFDVVVLSTVVSSILDDGMARNVAGEAARVLAPGGAVVWYDFRWDNPRNPHVRGVSRARVRALFPDFRVHLRTVTLLPPLARRLGRAVRVLYPPLAALPWLRTHYVGLLVKP
ncbi:MAG TPA: methyltransferase domain-containing protein [Candidatus Binatia bacterium]|nr:methyltransferase domain-containing protein [Candidatus Binatia bacterium]